MSLILLFFYFEGFPKKTLLTTAVSMPKRVHLAMWIPTFKIHQLPLITHVSTYSGTKPMTYQVEPLLKRLYGHQTPKETD